ncbi:MAG: hypothetical protein KIS86_18260 [Devosia sp.]|nr:hypothetical protein [Devosia sp.]
MATSDDKTAPKVAEVDFLVDENGARLDVPDGSKLKVAGEHEPSLGATSPTNWWLYGLVGLGIVVAMLFVMQMFSGAPGSDVLPGSPTSAPVVETPAP